MRTISKDLKKFKYADIVSTTVLTEDGFDTLEKNYSFGEKKDCIGTISTSISPYPKLLFGRTVDDEKVFITYQENSISVNSVIWKDEGDLTREPDFYVQNVDRNYRRTIVSLKTNLRDISEVLDE